MKHLILLLFFLSPQAYACTLAAELLDNDHPTTGCPADVTGVVQRAARCTHWAGEEATDKARQKEITKGMQENYCETLPCDAKNLSDHYAAQPQVQRVLAHAWETLYDEKIGVECKQR